MECCGGCSLQLCTMQAFLQSRTKLRMVKRTSSSLRMCSCTSKICDSNLQQHRCL